MPRALVMAGALAGAMAVPSICHADEVSGLYIGASVGSARGGGGTYPSGADASFNAALGYRFNETFSAEVFSRSLSFIRFDTIFSNDRYYYPDSHVGVALRAALLLGNGFGVYGRAGYGRTSENHTQQDMPSASRNEGSLGLGLAYDFNKTVGLKLEANRFLQSDVSSYSLGVEVRF